MKSNTRPTIPGLRLALATLGLATFLLLAIPSAQAGPIQSYTITLTELSSTSLTATYDGPGATFSVPLNTGTDTWTVSYTPTLYSTFTLTPFVIDWTEPENPSEFNEVTHGIDFGNINNLYVASDESLAEYFGDFSTMHPDNTRVLVGTDNGLQVFLTFHDLASASETGTGVPESGSSLWLLALSAAGLAGLRRFRRPQLLDPGC
jgi:MYXO-CTERM domain-containing protein